MDPNGKGPSLRDIKYGPNKRGLALVSDRTFGNMVEQVRARVAPPAATPLPTQAPPFLAAVWMYGFVFDPKHAASAGWSRARAVASMRASAGRRAAQVVHRVPRDLPDRLLDGGTVARPLDGAQLRHHRAHVRPHPRPRQEGAGPLLDPRGLPSPGREDRGRFERGLDEVPRGGGVRCRGRRGTTPPVRLVLDAVRQEGREEANERGRGREAEKGEAVAERGADGRRARVAVDRIGVERRGRRRAEGLGDRLDGRDRASDGAAW